MYDIKKYREAYSLEEALSCLRENPDAVIISGGTDILIRIREGKIRSAHLIGIGRIDSLKEIYEDENSTLHIGPLMTFSLIEKNSLINKHLPVLAEAVSSAGGPQIRNTATVGGNICNGASSADSASVLLCYNADLVLESENGKRTVPLNEFYLGPGKTVRRRDEILTDIVIRKDDYDNYTGSFKKFSQREAMDIATLACSVLVKISDNIFTDIRIAFGVAAPTPLRCGSAEEAGRGLEVSKESISIISKAVLNDIKPRDSWRGSKDFRLHLAEVLSYRGLCRTAGLEENSSDKKN